LTRGDVRSNRTVRHSLALSIVERRAQVVDINMTLSLASNQNTRPDRERVDTARQVAMAVARTVLEDKKRTLVARTQLVVAIGEYLAAHHQYCFQLIGAGTTPWTFTRAVWDVAKALSDQDGKSNSQYRSRINRLIRQTVGG
jgi:hypothetical protein